MAIRWSTTSRHLLALGGLGRAPAPPPYATPRGRRAAAGPRRGAAGRTVVQARGVRRAAAGAPRRARARARTGAGRPAPTTGRRRGRPARSAARPGRTRRAGPRAGPAPGAAGQPGRPRPSSSLSTRIVEQLLPDLVAAPRCAACRARATSNASAQSSGLSQTSAHGVSTSMPSRRRLLVEPHRRLDRRRPSPPSPSAGPPPGRARPAPSRPRAPGRAACRSARPPRRGWAARRRRRRGRAGAARRTSTPPRRCAEPRVGVEQVGRAVQRDDRLAGARSAVDDERAARAGPDDGVLVGLDGAEHVAHPGRAAACRGWR